MIERANCRGVRCRGKTNSVAPRSQTMNQRARHAFASFTRSDDRKDETVVGMRARDERSDRGLRDRKTDARKERERESVLGKSEMERNDCQRQRLRCPFWPLLMPTSPAMLR